jgi:hypothetical protein
METGNKKALIAAFYLSKYDEQAYLNLGYGNASDTHKKIGEILEVKSSSVKNMRDEFDPLHSNERVGWYQRPLRPSRQKVFDLFTDLSEISLRAVVLNLLNSLDNEELSTAIESIEIDENTHNDSKAELNTRAITGEQAELYFLEHWKHHYPKFVNIENCTKDGCGYDFKLISDNSTRYIEVKGMKSLKGSILLTDKEWKIAHEKVDSFDLIIVSDLENKPKVQIITNVVNKLQPSMQIRTVLQVSWSVPPKQFNNLQ